MWVEVPLEIGVSPVRDWGSCGHAFVPPVRGSGSLRAGMGVPVSRWSLWAGVCHQERDGGSLRARNPCSCEQGVFTAWWGALAVNLVGEICSPQAAFSQAGIHTVHLALNELFILPALPPGTVFPYSNKTNDLPVVT